MPKHAFPAAAEGMPDATSLEEKFEDLLSQAHELRCMALVSQDSINNIIYPGSPHPAHPAYYYVADLDREIIGFSIANVLNRAVALEKAVEILFGAYGARS